MAKLRGADEPESDEPEDIAEMARVAHQFALHMNTDPPLPRPGWLPEHAGAMPPADLLALIEEHDPQAVAEARASLARRAAHRRPKEH